MTLPMMTVQTRFVLLVLLQQPEREVSGEEIADLLTLSPELVSEILARLGDAEWVTERTEPAEESSRGGEPRRVHRLTAVGVGAARQVLARGLTPYFTALAERLGLDLEVISP